MTEAFKIEIVSPEKIILSSDITSATNEPKSRSDGFSFFRIFPMNDLFDTDTRIGLPDFIDFKFFKINKSLLSQSELIFVKKAPIPFFRKNPIAGSKIIFVLGMFTDLAISKLSFNNCFTLCSWFPVMIFLL